jgi:hypothetical protein
MTTRPSFLPSWWRTTPWFGLLLLLGCWYWFSLCTDFSLAGTIPDIIFPPLAASLALVAFRGTASITNRLRRWLYRAACLPLILGGLVYVITAALIGANFFGMLFVASEMLSEEQIARVVSPNTQQEAYVYFQGMGAYAGGDGHFLVRVRYRYLPIVERDVYAVHSYSGQAVQVSWQDNDNIMVEHDSIDGINGTTIDIVNLGFAKLEPPLALLLLTVLVQ